ncbi:hypothetical protein EIP86_006800 [Pleurotus ostreatoroseus]|nr:hypothetical protein EIP86_006800 [Pleurotus ostreatoroseus]
MSKAPRTTSAAITTTSIASAKGSGSNTGNGNSSGNGNSQGTPKAKPPMSSLAAFLNALSWSRAHKEPDFDAGLNASSAWTAASPEDARASLVSAGSPVSLNVNALSDEEDDGEADKDAEEDPDADGEEDPALGAEEQPGRAARALYAFEGKPEFRELTSVRAGDRLEVLKEEVGDGWSLVRHFAEREKEKEDGGEVKRVRSEVGLLPSTYYAFTADFAHAPSLELPSGSRAREASSSSLTPRGSPTRQLEEADTPAVVPARPIVPQTTGEWFPSFRRSLLGGRQLNRFSSFVTSGAEEWVLKGTGEEQDVALGQTSDTEEDAQASGHARGHSRLESSVDEGRTGRVGEADRHFVDAGPAWAAKLPPFRVLVHSPSRRASILSGAYTVYAVTSLFSSTASSSSSPSSPSTSRAASPARTKVEAEVRITVHRRFSHFVALHTALARRLPGVALPPLPEKQYAGRFNDDFVEARRGDLERYLARVVRHPVARYAEVLTFFLGCENDGEWKRQYPRYLAMPPAGPSFYAHVFHPAFNLDADDATEAVDRFVEHARAVGKGVQGLRSTFGKVREASVEMSKAQRLLAYSMLSLITSKPLASAPTTGINEEDEEDASGTRGHMNEDGAWCWREGCDDCLKLTKAMQKTSETFQTVADLYEDHARRTQLITHEGLKNVAHPSAIYSGIVDTHRSTLARYNEVTQPGFEDEEVAARCETVLNTTMAEFETYHTQKAEDFHGLTTEILDGEIELYEQILLRLRTARRTLDSPVYDTLAEDARQPSIYERELEHPRLTPMPLTQPCPHVYDSAPMRPVSVALQEGVGMLLSPTRASVFGKFW